MSITREEVERLEFIKEDLSDLIHEAFEIVKRSSERAISEAYWKNQMLSSLGEYNPQYNIGNLESVIKTLKSRLMILKIFHNLESIKVLNTWPTFAKLVSILARRTSH